MKIRKEDLYNLIEEELDGTLEESVLDYLPDRISTPIRGAYEKRPLYVPGRIFRPSAYYDDPAGPSGVDPDDPVEVASQDLRPGLFMPGFAPADDVAAAQERGFFGDIAADYDPDGAIRRNIKTAGILIPAGIRGMYDQARDAAGGIFGGGDSEETRNSTPPLPIMRPEGFDTAFEGTPAAQGDYDIRGSREPAGTPPAPSAPGSTAGSGPRRTPATAPAAAAPADSSPADSASAEPPGVVGYRGPRRQIVRAMAADALDPGLPTGKEARRARQVARQAVRRKGEIEYSPIGRNVKRVMITPDELKQALQEALEEELRSLN